MRYDAHILVFVCCAKRRVRFLTRYYTAPRATRELLVPCTNLDPRCATCEAHVCVTCADTLLNSERRSGKRTGDIERLVRGRSFLHSPIFRVSLCVGVNARSLLFYCLGTDR